MNRFWTIGLPILTVGGGVLWLGAKSVKDLSNLGDNLAIRTLGQPFIKVSTEGILVEVLPIIDNPTQTSVSITEPTVFAYLNGSELTRSQNNPHAKITIESGYGKFITQKVGKEEVKVKYKFLILWTPIVKVFPKLLLKIPSIVANAFSINRDYTKKVKAITSPNAKALPPTDKVVEGISDMSVEELVSYIPALQGIGNVEEVTHKLEVIKEERDKKIVTLLADKLGEIIKLEYAYNFYVAGFLYSSGKIKLF